MRMKPWRLRAAVIAALMVLMGAMSTTAIAGPVKVDTTGATLRYFDGLQQCPNSTVSSMSWMGTSGGDIRLGNFGKNGQVVNGDAVLAVAADLGTAPVTSLYLPGVMDPTTGSFLHLTPDRPTGSGALIGGSGINWNNGLAMQPGFTTVAEGSGTAVVRFALLTRDNQSWTKAPGATLPLNILVGSTCPVWGAIAEVRLTVGGGT